MRMPRLDSRRCEFQPLAFVKEPVDGVSAQVAALHQYGAWAERRQLLGRSPHTGRIADWQSGQNRGLLKIRGQQESAGEQLLLESLHSIGSKQCRPVLA